MRGWGLRATTCGTWRRRGEPLRSSDRAVLTGTHTMPRTRTRGAVGGYAERAELGGSADESESADELAGSVSATGTLPSAPHERSRSRIMGTTFQGRGEVRTPRGGSERRSLVDTLAMRLTAIGASDEEVEAWHTSWIESPPVPEEVEWARHVTDAELVHELRKTRAEYAEHTTLDGDESETGGAPDEGSSPSADDAVKAALDEGDTLEAQRLVLEQLEGTPSHGHDASSEPEPQPVDAEALAAAVEAAAPDAEGEPAGEQPEAAEPEPEPVVLPDDVVRVDAIIEWVGGDPARARAALDAEDGRSTQRSTLVETLEMIIRAAAI